jgi:16S rRNA (cytosine967-C5)-methyltransferase
MAGAYALPNGSNAEIEGLAEVQDLNSQRAIAVLKPAEEASVWDCCAASGGKSLALFENHPGIELYLSDVRENILKNLQERFSRNGIRQYALGVIGLEEPLEELNFYGNLSGQNIRIPKSYFDVIIADVPCSGSGTWGRVPEQMQICSSGNVAGYAHLQRKIVTNALPFLKSGGQLIYITCSVFASENEDQVAHFCLQHGLTEISRQQLEGYSEKADNLFVAVLKKSGST